MAGSRVLGESILVDRFPFDQEDPIWPVMPRDFKSHAQIGHNFDDLLLMLGSGGYLAAATEMIESRGQVSLIHQRRQIVLDELPCAESIHVSRGPLVSIQSVTYLDKDLATQTLSTTMYRSKPSGRQSAIYFLEKAEVDSLAEGPGVVAINVTCGFGDAPDKVPAMWRQIVAEVAAHMYERRTLIAGGGLDEAFERVVDRKVVLAGGVRRYV